MSVNRPSRKRRQLWSAAYRAFKKRGLSAKFLVGTDSDRQTGALRTHDWRKAMGVHGVAPGDHALLRTLGSDGESRLSHWTPDHDQALKLWTPVAERIRAGVYRPAALKIARIPKPNGKKRIIAVPTVIDRTLQAVVLELIEPVIDPILSHDQHGYRGTRVNGKKSTVSGFTGKARGSIEVVAYKLKRALGDGFVCMAEVDIVNAFPTVSRDVLVEMLVADGCPRKFAKILIRMMGNEAVERGKTVPMTGIPLGCPYGPVLFNFFVRFVHDRMANLSAFSTSLRLVSYADNFFIAAKSEADLDIGVAKLMGALDDLSLTGKIDQRWVATGMTRPFSILNGKEEGGFILHLGQGVLRPVLRGSSESMQGEVVAHGLPMPVRSVLGGQEVEEALGGDVLRDVDAEGQGSSPSLPCSPVPVSDPAGVGVAVRKAAFKGGHRPISSRYVDEEPDRDRESADPPARKRTASARPGVNSDAHHALHDAAPDEDGAVEGGAVAEFTFPASPAEVPAVLNLKPTKKAGVTVTVPADVSKLSERDLVTIWASLSKRLVGIGVKRVMLKLPLNGRLLVTPGLFGCPRQSGGEGDDHWRVSGYPPRSNGLDIILQRRGRADEDRRRTEVRRSGCHVTAYPEAVGRWFRGVVRGVVNPILVEGDDVILLSAGKKAVNMRASVRSPNPTTAIATALAQWLEDYKAEVPVTIWIADDLVRSAIRGEYLDVGRTKYSEVKGPDMNGALSRLQKAVKQAKVVVKIKSAKRRGAVSREIIGSAVAVENVNAFATELAVVSISVWAGSTAPSVFTPPPASP